MRQRSSFVFSLCSVCDLSVFDVVLSRRPNCDILHVYFSETNVSVSESQIANCLKTRWIMYALHVYEPVFKWFSCQHCDCLSYYIESWYTFYVHSVGTISLGFFDLLYAQFFSIAKLFITFLKPVVPSTCIQFQPWMLPYILSRFEAKSK